MLTRIAASLGSQVGLGKTRRGQVGEALAAQILYHGEEVSSPSS